MKSIKPFSLIILAVIFTLTCYITSLHAQDNQDKIPDNNLTKTNKTNLGNFPNFADIVEELLPAVVNISTTQNTTSSESEIEELLNSLPEGSFSDKLKDFLQGGKSKNHKISALGSGFIVSKDGYIVTNHHVIDNAEEIMVGLNNSKKFEAKVIGFDKKTDLALLKIDADYDLKYVEFGDSTNSRIGEWVIAVGNPFGLGGSVSVGIISADGRDISSGNFDNFIQTDAAINKGNSGGPLFNVDGQVVGVATAIFSPSGGNVGIGFATPAAVAVPIIKQLKEKGKVIRGWLGVSIYGVSDQMAKALDMKEAKGAIVVKVNEDSPAERAGILPTDVIISFDGKPINTVKQLPEIVSATEINKKVKISVFRQGKIKTLTTRVGLLREEQDKESLETKYNPEASFLGISLVDLDKKIRKDYYINDDIKGILVLKVDPDGQGAEKGIEAGDLILSANQIPVDSISDLEKIIESSKKENKKDILLFVKRDKLESAVLVPIAPITKIKTKYKFKK